MRGNVKTCRTKNFKYIKEKPSIIEFKTTLTACLVSKLRSFNARKLYIYIYIYICLKSLLV